MGESRFYGFKYNKRKQGAAAAALAMGNGRRAYQHKRNMAREGLLEQEHEQARQRLAAARQRPARRGFGLTRVVTRSIADTF